MGYMRDASGRRLDAFKVADAAPAIPALALAALPTHLNNQMEYNAVAFTRDNVVTTPAGVQYAIWWDARRMPIIGKRTLPSGAWSTFDLSTVTGNPLAAPVVTDGHNNICLGVDPAGYIHISGNHHDVPLIYVRSTSPGDITAWTAPGMVGTNEDSVTYPQFVTLPNGTFLFIYRNGVSGDGDVFINKLTSLTWSRVSRPLVGSSLTPAQSPYINQPMVSASGKLGFFVVYRLSNNAAGNHDIGYLESIDGGATWRTIAGAALTLPVYAAGATGTGLGSALPLALTSTGQGLINQSGAAYDSRGYPHGAVWLNNTGDSSKLDLHHIWWNGTTWRDDIVITAADNGSAATTALARVSTVCTNDGHTLLIYRINKADPGSLWCLDVSDTGTRYPTFKLADLDLGGYEPTYDYNAVRTLNQLHMLLTPTFRGDAPTVGSNVWQGQWGAVLSLDLSQIGLVAAGLVPAPTLTRVARASTSGATTSSAALADVAAATLPVAPKADLVVTRVVASASAGSGRITLQQRPAVSSANVDLASLPVCSGGAVPVTTVAAGSNSTSSVTFNGSSTLNVASTTGFPSSGTLVVNVGDPNNVVRGNVLIDYTGTTGTTFTGCTTHLAGITGGAVLYTGALVQLALVAASPWQPVRLDLGDFSGGAKLVPRIAAPSALTLDSLAVEVGIIGQPARPTLYTAPRGVLASLLGKLLGYWKVSSLSGTTSGASISSWADGSGNGWALANAAASQPTYAAAGINGKPSLAFSGTQVLETISTKPISLTYGFAMATVAVTTSTASASTQVFAAADNGATRIFQARYDANAAAISALGFNGAGALQTTSAAIGDATTNPRVFLLQRGQRFLSLEGNGSRLARTADSGDTPNGSAASTFTVGRRSNVGSDGGLIGYLGDTMLFAAPLSGQEASAVQSILALAYGITLA